jgi:hypothetical protein
MVTPFKAFIKEPYHLILIKSSVNLHNSSGKKKVRLVRSWSFIRKREIGTRSPDPDQSFPGIGESMPIGLQKNRGSKKIYRKEAEPPAPAGPR